MHILGADAENERKGPYNTGFLWLLPTRETIQVMKRWQWKLEAPIRSRDDNSNNNEDETKKKEKKNGKKKKVINGGKAMTNQRSFNDVLRKINRQQQQTRRGKKKKRKLSGEVNSMIQKQSPQQRQQQTDNMLRPSSSSSSLSSTASTTTTSSLSLSSSSVLAPTKDYDDDDNGGSGGGRIRIEIVSRELRQQFYETKRRHEYLNKLKYGDDIDDYSTGPSINFFAAKADKAINDDVNVDAHDDDENNNDPSPSSSSLFYHSILPISLFPVGKILHAKGDDPVTLGPHIPPNIRLAIDNFNAKVNHTDSTGTYTNANATNATTTRMTKTSNDGTAIINGTVVIPIILYHNNYCETTCSKPKRAKAMGIIWNRKKEK